MVSMSDAPLMTAKAAASPGPRRGLLPRLRVRLTIVRATIREYAQFDSTIYRSCAAFVGLCGGLVCLIAGRDATALRLLSAMHRAAYLRLADRLVESLFGRALSGGPTAPLTAAARQHVFTDTAAPPQLASKPDALLGPLAMVLRSPTAERKGIIVLQYNYVFPLFARHYDATEIARRYDLVLEPSWSGYCNADVLCYAGMTPRVFVQAFEPRDREFLVRMNAGFEVIPTSTNWWVNHRIFRPLPGTVRDVDRHDRRVGILQTPHRIPPRITRIAAAETKPARGTGRIPPRTHHR